MPTTLWKPYKLHQDLFSISLQIFEQISATVTMQRFARAIFALLALQANDTEGRKTEVSYSDTRKSPSGSACNDAISKRHLPEPGSGCLRIEDFRGRVCADRRNPSRHVLELCRYQRIRLLCPIAHVCREEEGRPRPRVAYFGGYGHDVYHDPMPSVRCVSRRIIEAERRAARRREQRLRAARDPAFGLIEHFGTFTIEPRPDNEDEDEASTSAEPRRPHWTITVSPDFLD